MIIKKFVAKTEEEAIAAAKKELGDNVVVMNVKAIKPKGILALFGGKKMEVTVALEADTTPIRPQQRENPVRAESLENQVRATQNAVHVMSESSQNIEKKLDSLQNLLVSQLKQENEKAEEKKQSEIETEKHHEAAAEKKKSDAPEKKITEQEKFTRLLYNTMLENEVDEKYVNQIMEDIDCDTEGKKDLPIDYILASVYQKMILKFGKAEGIMAAGKQPKVVVFMGPTGVGKTTTIAKIASKYSMEEGKKIALLTADTYRIAAAEQLRVYANILEVPFRVIYTEEEAVQAIGDFSDCDYIFVDTAGHSHRNEEQLGHMKSLVEAIQKRAECQGFLVLSATTKYSDLMKIVSIYQDITKYQLIFTKLDETSAIGSLLNIKMFTDTPIAFVTYGQNVPNDITVFNAQKAVKRLLSTKQEDIYA